MRTSIFLDAAIVGMRRGGIWRYFRELVAGLRASGEFELTLYAAERAGLDVDHFVQRLNFKGRGRAGIDSLLTARAFARSGCRVFYSSNNTPPWTGLTAS